MHYVEAEEFRTGGHRRTRVCVSIVSFSQIFSRCHDLRNDVNVGADDAPAPRFPLVQGYTHRRLRPQAGCL